ncbi:MAG: hypothetical protein Q8L41_01125 [Anaerolineales bacterium]|nr:hypothetical protein [Anaerolineales bacterium]
MNMFSPFLTLDCSCDEALQWSSQNLMKSGLRVMRTFDLHTARHALKDCPCPHHGTSACDCQMLVLLVYGEALEPVTLILHGNDGQTWLSIADTPNQKTNIKTVAAIKNALEGKLPARISNRA